MMKKIARIGILAFVMALLACFPAFAKSTKAKYTINKITEYYSGPRCSGIYTFELPQIKGNTKAARKINSSLKSEYKKTLSGARSIKEFAESPYFPERGATLWYRITCKVTYNKKNIVCFCFYSDWWAGGVHNAHHYGATYNLKTGKRLYLNDVMSGSKSSIRTKIVNAFVKKLGYNKYDYDRVRMIRKNLSSTKFKDIKFWLKNGKVYVNNGSYAPGGGNGEVIVKLSGKY